MINWTLTNPLTRFAGALPKGEPFFLPPPLEDGVICPIATSDGEGDLPTHQIDRSFIPSHKSTKQCRGRPPTKKNFYLTVSNLICRYIQRLVTKAPSERELSSECETEGACGINKKARSIQAKKISFRVLLPSFSCENATSLPEGGSRHLCKPFAPLNLEAQPPKSKQP